MIYHPERTFGRGESRAEEKLWHLWHKPLRILTPVISQDMLGHSGITHDHEIAGPSCQSVHGTVFRHPLVQWQEEGPTEQIRHVIQFRIGDRDARIVARGEGSCQRGEPVGAHPWTTSSFVFVERSSGDEASVRFKEAAGWNGGCKTRGKRERWEWERRSSHGDGKWWMVF